MICFGSESWAQNLEFINQGAVRKNETKDYAPVFVNNPIFPFLNSFGKMADNDGINAIRSELSLPVKLRPADTSQSLPLPPVLQDVLSAGLDYERLNNKLFLLDVIRGGRGDLSKGVGRRTEGSRPLKNQESIAPKPQAQEGSEEDKTFLTLEKALARARQQSPEAKGARASYEMSSNNALVTLGSYGPKIDYRNGRGREISYNGLSSPASVYPDHERVDKSLTLRQPLIDLNIMAGYKRDLLSAEAASFNRDVTEETLNQDVLGFYFDLLQALIGISIADEYQKRLEGLMTYISRRAEGGIISDVELQRVQAASLGAERVKLDAVSARDVALVNLERMIGPFPDQIAFPVRSLANMPSSPELALPLLIARSSELKANQKLADAAYYDQIAALARFSPKLDLEIGQYDTKNPSGAFGKTQDKRGMLTMSVNLLNGGSDYSYVRAQAAKREQVEYQYQSVYYKSIQRLRVYYLTLQGVNRQIQTSKKEYLTYKTVADDYDRQLAVAPKSITDLLDVNNKYYQAKINLMNLNIKRLQLAYAINFYLKEF